MNYLIVLSYNIKKVINNYINLRGELLMSNIFLRLNDKNEMFIPKNVLDLYGINIGNQVEISCDKDNIIIRKLNDECVFCRTKVKLDNYMNTKICENCKIDIRYQHLERNTYL